VAEEAFDLKSAPAFTTNFMGSNATGQNVTALQAKIIISLWLLGAVRLKMQETESAGNEQQHNS